MHALVYRCSFGEIVDVCPMKVVWRINVGSADHGWHGEVK
jgi:hypothetical protein